MDTPPPATDAPLTSYWDLVFASPDPLIVGGALLIFVISLIYKAPNLGTDKESVHLGALSLQEQHSGSLREWYHPLAWLEALWPPPPPPPGAKQIANILQLSREARSGAVIRALAAYDLGGGSAAVAKKKNVLRRQASYEVIASPNYQWRPAQLQLKRKKMTLVLDLDETLVHSTENPESSQRNRGGTYLPHDEIISIPRNSSPSLLGVGGPNSPGNNEAPPSGEKQGGKRWWKWGKRPPPPSPPREKKEEGRGSPPRRAETPLFDSHSTPRRQGSSVSGGSGGSGAGGGGTKSIYVWKRPFLDVFLREAARHYEIVVYTAGHQRYANQVIDRIDLDGVVRRRFFRDSCEKVDDSSSSSSSSSRDSRGGSPGRSRNHAPENGGSGGSILLGKVGGGGQYRKDISKPDIVPHEHYPERVVFLDNTPAAYESTCPDNAIPIKSWYGTDPNDDELLSVLVFLNALSAVNDVRSVLRLRRLGQTEKGRKTIQELWKKQLHLR